VRIPRILKWPKAGSGDFTYQSDKYEDGNKVTFLETGGRTYGAMLSAIEAARQSVHFETYILRADKTGRRFEGALAAKAREGVRVRLIIDSVGSFDLDPAYLTRLRNAGVQILEYHPIAPWRPRWAWGRRDHRKILVVDSRVGFTGSININDDHAPLAEGGRDWHDAHVKVEGPAALTLDRLFRAVWFRETQRWFGLDGPVGQTHGRSKVWVAANEEFLHRYRIRSAYINALQAARDHVCIANSYFLPDIPSRMALASAARRGVDVRLLVQGRTDITSIWYASRDHYDYLLRHGVRLYEWSGPVLHQKTCVVDDTWCSVGSYNMDHLSLLRNLEVNLHILDKDFSARLRRSFEADVAVSRPILLEHWRQRPLGEKIVERLFHALSSLL
jgi:cardiolipin synthase